MGDEILNPDVGRLLANSLVRLISIEMEIADLADILYFSGRAIYYLSTTSFSSVYNKLKSRLDYVANASDDNQDLDDLRILAYIRLTRAQLEFTLSSKTRLYLSTI